MLNENNIVFGTANFGLTLSQDQAFELMDAYEEMGGRVFDTSNAYGYADEFDGVAADAIVGNWLKNKDRSQFKIFSKIGSKKINGTREGLSQKSIDKAIDGVLNNLQTDYIDVVLPHHDDTSVTLFEMWTTFSKLCHDGQAKSIGLSNFSADRIDLLVEMMKGEDYLKPIEYVKVKCNEVKHVHGRYPDWAALYDDKMKKFLKSKLPNAKVLVFSPLMGGAYEYKNLDELPEHLNSEENKEIIKKYQKYGKENGLSASASVLLHLVKSNVLPVTAASKVSRLKDNLKFLEKI